MPPGQDIRSHFGAFVIVPIIGQTAFVYATDSRQSLRHIMKQRSIADNRISRRMGDDGQGMEPGIKRMKRQRLWCIRQMG